MSASNFLAKCTAAFISLGGAAYAQQAPEEGKPVITQNADGTTTKTMLSADGFYIDSLTTTKEDAFVSYSQTNNYNQLQVVALAQNAQNGCDEKRLAYFQQYRDLTPRQAATKITREILFSGIVNFANSAQMEPVEVAQLMMDEKLRLCAGVLLGDASGLAARAKDGSLIIVLAPPQGSPFNATLADQGVESFERLFALVEGNGLESGKSYINYIQVAQINRDGSRPDLCTEASTLICEYGQFGSSVWADKIEGEGPDGRPGPQHTRLMRTHFVLPIVDPT